MIRIENPGARWHSRNPTLNGHIDPPTFGRSTWEPSDPARRVENRERHRIWQASHVVLAPGMLVIHDRKPKRIVEIRPVPDDLWPERFETAWDKAVEDRARYSPEKPPHERATWKDRPVTIVLAEDKPAAREEHWQAPASLKWEVLSEHYAVCRACGQLPPCDHELADRAVDIEMARAERLMAIPRGCCLGCGDPITHRMNTKRFPGPNLWRPDLGDGSAVFHARQGCEGFAARYEEQWEAANKAAKPAGQLAFGEDGA